MTRQAGWIAGATGGTLITTDPLAIAAGDVCTDTRLLAPGDVYLALPGEQVEGGRFVGDALERGAGGVIAAPAFLEGVDTGTAFAVAVQDPQAALRELAHAWRVELDCRFAIGVTGAAGKTTTKDLLTAMLRPLMPVHSTRHGFNTHQGVAATLAAAPVGTRALVVEVAMRRRGDIATKAAMLRPTAGLITNVGPEHLETAGTVADVARNKAELLEALPPGAPCVIPAEEPLLERHVRSDLRTVRHGDGGDVFLKSFRDGIAEMDCRGETLRLHAGLDQPHNLENVVAATAMAWALGIRPQGRLDASFTPLRWQLERIGAVEVILDCAKTSPLALRRALETFAAEPAEGRRIAVLGELPELGEHAAFYHAEAGRQLRRVVDVLITVGEPARAFLTGYAGEHYAVASPAEARALLYAMGAQGDRALVKGRQRDKLERILA